MAAPSPFSLLKSLAGLNLTRLALRRREKLDSSTGERIEGVVRRLLWLVGPPSPDGVFTAMESTIADR